MVSEHFFIISKNGGFCSRIKNKDLTPFIHVDDVLVEQGANTFYYHKDGLGSVINLTDASGNVVKSYTYKGFGEIYSETGTLNQPFTFTGREFDPESGLYFYRARYYDPRAGRFLTKDPIGFAGEDVNLYRYVQNNPINLLDSLGLDPVDLKTGKVNPVLRCHVNPHTDLKENAIGGSLITAGFLGIALAPTAATIGSSITAIAQNAPYNVDKIIPYLPAIQRIFERMSQGQPGITDIPEFSNQIIERLVETLEKAKGQKDTCSSNKKEAIKCH